MKQTELIVLAGIVIIVVVFYVCAKQNVEYFSSESGNVLAVVHSVDKELDANAALYKCPDALGKGPVTTDTTVNDADKFGRCSIIMDFKTRLFQKVKDIVGV